MTNLRQVPEPEFSIVEGGPLFRALNRLLPGQREPARTGVRIIVAVLLTWVPLLVLATLEGRHGGLSFFRDIETHVRFLIALPIFILTELVVHRQLNTTVRLFLDWQIVPDHELPAFKEGIRKALAWRDSQIAEAALLIVALLVGHHIWQQGIALDEPTWYMVPTPDGQQTTRAGTWLAWVSIPIFQFLYIRWYYRLLIWYQFLWRVAHMDLRIVPAHPDRAGGLGFVSLSVYAFAPLLLAQGVLLAGLIASRIFGAGNTLLEFKSEILGLMIFIVVAFIGPLLMFSPLLMRARRDGLLLYGRLALEHGRLFQQKWIEAAEQARDEPFLGTADIQSQNDMNGVFEAVNQMRGVPFAPRLLLQLALVALAPLVPLLLTLVPLSTIIDWLLARLL